MGILTDYFIATSDTEAAGFLEGGVHGQGLPDGHVLESKGVDPYVALGTLTTFLTDRTSAGVTADSVTVTFSMDTGAVVVRVQPSLLEALAGADESALLDAADAGSRTEELRTEDPAPLAAFLHDLAELARTAAIERAGVYCWASP
jgi:hypothetical protein